MEWTDIQITVPQQYAETAEAIAFTCSITSAAYGNSQSSLYTGQLDIISDSSSGTSAP